VVRAQVEVGIAIPVVVEKGGLKGEVNSPIHTILESDLGEGAISEIPVQAIGFLMRGRGTVGDIKIKPPVVVEISPGAALTESGIMNTRRHAHGGEGEVAVVAEEMVGRAEAGEIKIEITIAIIITRDDSHGIGNEGHTGIERSVGEESPAIILENSDDPVSPAEQDDIRVSIIIEIGKRQAATETKTIGSQGSRFPGRGLLL